MMHPYATSTYAKTLDHWGTEFTVPEWGTSVVVRDIPSGARDACGVYPIAVLSPQSDLPGGLERLRKEGLVSITLVLDDFHRPALNDLQTHFSVVRPFKDHFVHRTITGEITYGSHHRYYVNKALEKVEVRVFSLQENLKDWTDLYTNLVKHRKLQGLHDFPKSHHSTLAQLDGVTAVGAWVEDRLVSAHVWVSDEDHVHSHLAASSPEGYTLNAAYAVNHHSLELFKEAKVINLGGGAGTESTDQDGLSKFKRGFTNGRATAYICGAILDQAHYETLSAEKTGTSFFPAYRSPSQHARTP